MALLFPNPYKSSGSTTIVTKYFLTFPAIVFFIVLPAYGQSEWAAEVELGMILTAGNTRSQALNSRTKITRSQTRWRHTARLDIFSSASQGRTTAERYAADFQADRRTSTANFFSFNLNYEKNRFTGIRERSGLAVAYGRRLFDQPAVVADVEIGPGFRKTRRTNAQVDEVGTLRTRFHLRWQPYNHATLTHEDLLEAGEDTVTSKSTTAFVLKINNHLAMKTALEISHNSNVAPDIRKTDSQTSLTLVYTMH